MQEYLDAKIVIAVFVFILLIGLLAFYFTLYSPTVTPHLTGFFSNMFSVVKGKIPSP